MLRPLYLDLLDIVLPLSAIATALAGGRFLDRLPAYLIRTVIGVAVSLIAFLGIAYFTPWHGTVSDAAWHIGGVTIVAGVTAMLLLGVVWTSPNRSTSTGFLGALVGIVVLIVLLDSGGRLWWRLVATTAWENVPDSAGGVRQSSGWTCSPAAAAMLLHQYGIATSEGEMAYLAGTNFLGTDAPSIAHALTAKATPQLTAQVSHTTYEACLDRMEPFLACVTLPGLGGHAVLVLRVRNEAVELVDPRVGQKQWMSRTEFKAIWQEKIIYFARN